MHFFETLNNRRYSTIRLFMQILHRQQLHTINSSTHHRNRSKKGEKLFSFPISMSAISRNHPLWLAVWRKVSSDFWTAGPTMEESTTRCGDSVLYCTPNSCMNIIQCANSHIQLRCATGRFFTWKKKPIRFLEVVVEYSYTEEQRSFSLVQHI